MLSSPYFKTISRILILAMIHLCWLTSYGYAEMIPTESSIEQSSTSNTDRQRLLDLLDRQEVIDELDKYGISKVEATARINSLTDEEVTEIAGKLDELPQGGQGSGGGGYGWPVAVLMLLIAIIVAAYISGVIYKGITCPFVDCEDSIFKPWWKDNSDSSDSGSGSGTESSEEMQDAARCYSICNSISYECINSEKIEKSEPQCEEDKQMCFRQCEGEEESDTVTVEDDCDPGMESCDS